MRRSSDMISPLHSNLESYYCGHCSFSFMQTADSYHRWIAEYAQLHAEPHTSCWIYRSVWQQSVALFSEVWKQKLIYNFNYCVQQHYH